MSASRKRLSSAAESVQRELDAIADEIAEAVTVSFFRFFFFTTPTSTSTRVPFFSHLFPSLSPQKQALDLHLASSAHLPAPRDSPLAYKAGGGEGREGNRSNDDYEERLALDALCASLGGYFRS